MLKALDETAEEWATTQDWTGEFDSDDDWLSLNPCNWLRDTTTGERKRRYAYFQLGGFEDHLEEEGGDQDWLVTLLRAGVGSMGIYLTRGNEIRKPDWRNALNMPEIRDVMRSLGFNYEDSEGSYFLRIPFEAEALAEGIKEGDMGRFLAPLRDALAKLPAAAAAMQPVIDKLRQPAN